MVGEGTPAIFVTFVLALVGYVGLTGVVVFSIVRRLPVVLWRGVAVVILVHVLMVWAFRYGWQFDLAVRNGYAGFAMFHGALACILVSTVVGEKRSRILVHIAFGIVTVGALGATFLYDVVSAYRIPVILCAGIGGFFLFRAYVLKRPAA